MYHLITEEWHGKPIRVRQEDAWWNLTEMCASCGKEPYEFLRLPSTIEYRAALAEKLGVTAESLVAAERGGDRKSDAIKPGKSHLDSSVIKPGKSRFDSGTWAHPFLAMECARWLSPGLSIRCNEVIIRLLNGETVQGAPLTPPQRRLRKSKLKMRASELRVEIDALRRQLEALKAAEDLPGHVAVREWLHGRCVLSHGELTRLCTRLSKEARRGVITAGEKTLQVNNLARMQRVPTYAPEVIAKAAGDLFPALLD